MAETDVPEDIEVKIASNAAEQFCQSYYPALNTPNGRATLTSFYIKPNDKAPAQADITLNGNNISDPSELQSMFENQIGRATYEAQSYDCHVINKNYNVGLEESQMAPNKDGRKMSIAVTVSGSVMYCQKDVKCEVRGFTEAIVLVPNMEAYEPMAPRGAKKWLVQSQTFRLVS